MLSLTIDAKNLASAHGFLAAVTSSGFQADLMTSLDGTHHVLVRLDGSDRDIRRVLKVIEEHVNTRQSGPARLELDGHQYTMHPVSDPGGLD